MFQDATINQHQHMIFIIINKQIKSLSTFSNYIQIQYFKLITTIQI